MDFGEALKLLKEGKSVCRNGWNGKGMYLFIENFEGVNGDSHPDERYKPCIVMFTADKKYQPGWLPSQEDLLATDWQEVKYEESGK